MNFAKLRNELKTLNYYQAVVLLVGAWGIVLLLVWCFVPLHGHQSWWQSKFHHKASNDQSATPVPQTEDNNARLYVIDFYHSYTSASDSDKRKALVSKNSSADFYTQYIADKDTDDVTCSNAKVTSVQIADQILFAKYLSYDLIERNSSGVVAGPVVALDKVNGNYQIIGVSCGLVAG